MSVLVPIENAPAKICFVVGDEMLCSWVKKGEFALMADDGGYIKFPLKRDKNKTSSDEEEVPQD